MAVMHRYDSQRAAEDDDDDVIWPANLTDLWLKNNLCGWLLICHKVSGADI